jgi:hypothetical protein
MIQYLETILLSIITSNIKINHLYYNNIMETLNLTMKDGIYVTRYVRE